MSSRLLHCPCGVCAWVLLGAASTGLREAEALGQFSLSDADIEKELAPLLQTSSLDAAPGRGLRVPGLFEQAGASQHRAPPQQPGGLQLLELTPEPLSQAVPPLAWTPPASLEAYPDDASFLQQPIGGPQGSIPSRSPLSLPAPRRPTTPPSPLQLEELSRPPAVDTFLVPPDTELEETIDRTQHVASVLAQDAAALARELQALGSAFGSGAAPTAAAATAPTAARVRLSQLQNGAVNGRAKLWQGARQVPYLPPPDANVLAAESPAGSQEKEEATRKADPEKVEDKDEDKDEDDDKGKPSFFKSFLTMNSKISIPIGVVVWSVIFLSFAGCTGVCCMSMRRRPRAQEGALM